MVDTSAAFSKVKRSILSASSGGRAKDDARGKAVLNFPETVVPQCLREHHLDLAQMTDRQLLEHWLSWGEQEGRVASYPALREHFIPLAAGSILEIGPFNVPALRGPKVKYLDVLNAEGLRARAAEIGLDASGCPEKIHYSHLSEVSETFDVVFSSHNIEHQPDIIQHLTDVNRVLTPGGVFMLMVPDKRFCFDHFLPETSVADVLDARGRSVHSLKSVIEHLTMTGHNDALAYWRGQPGPPPDPMAKLEKALSTFEDARGGYIDVHAWQFTPRTFEALIFALNRLGLISLRPHRIYSTPYGRHEFAVVLAS